MNGLLHTFCANCGQPRSRSGPDNHTCPSTIRERKAAAAAYLHSASSSTSSLSDGSDLRREGSARGGVKFCRHCGKMLSDRSALWKHEGGKNRDAPGAAVCMRDPSVLLVSSSTPSPPPPTSIAPAPSSASSSARSSPRAKPLASPPLQRSAPPRPQALRRPPTTSSSSTVPYGSSNPLSHSYPQSHGYATPHQLSTSTWPNTAQGYDAYGGAGYPSLPNQWQSGMEPSPFVNDYFSQPIQTYPPPTTTGYY